MDLFGRERTKQLEKDLSEAQAQQRTLANQVEYLVRTIRDMDQEIFNMSQRTDWSGMRPHFNKLQDEMIARKVAESKRITDILRPELIDTYFPQQKRLTK